MRVKAPIIVDALEPRQLLSGYIDLPGVMPAALDLPHINALLRRAAGDPLTASLNGEPAFNIDTVLSTGASGIILSSSTASALVISRLTHGGQPVIFSEAGVAATDDFAVSEPLLLHLAPGHPDADLNNLDTWMWTYDQALGPVSVKISGEDPSVQGLDIMGMPALAGKVLVIDPRPANTFADTTRAYVYAPGTPYNALMADFSPGIPAANLHIQLSYASFARFSSIAPDGAAGPTLAAHPFIGPDPVAALAPDAPTDNTPGVTVRYGAASATGSWLLDTGSSASIISLASAQSMGVHYAPGTFNTASPLLVDAAQQPLPSQFTMDLGGAAGTHRVAGFFLSSLEIPTAEGQTLRFLNAPVLVSDITVKDPDTLETLTLDGVLGMNFLIASGHMTQTGTDPVFTNLTAGAFDWITLDQPAGLLALSYTDPATRPTAALNTVNITRAGGDSHTFTVTYRGNPAIDWMTVDDDDILVVGPDGIEHYAWFVELDAEADGPARIATYMMDAPDYEWDRSDNGVYRVYLQAGAVTDTEGRGTAAAQLGAFTVGIRDTAAPRASTTKLASPRKGSTYTFKVTYRDDVAVRAATIGRRDLLVTGPRGFKQAAKLVSKSSRRDAGTITATYRITAPGRRWDALDKGVYVILLQRRQVTDTSGNFAAARKIGKFTYVPPKTRPSAVKQPRISAATLAAAPFSMRPILKPSDDPADPVWR